MWWHVHNYVRRTPGATHLVRIKKLHSFDAYGEWVSFSRMVRYTFLSALKLRTSRILEGESTRLPAAISWVLHKRKMCIKPSVKEITLKPYGIFNDITWDVKIIIPIHVCWVVSRPIEWFILVWYVFWIAAAHVKWYAILKKHFFFLLWFRLVVRVQSEAYNILLRKNTI